MGTPANGQVQVGTSESSEGVQCYEHLIPVSLSIYTNIVNIDTTWNYNSPLPDADAKQRIFKLWCNDHLEHFQRWCIHNLKIKLLVATTVQTQ